MSGTIVLLGPQRLVRTAAGALHRLGVEGPVAIITAGWQERENDDRVLHDHLDGRAVNLHLHSRGEDVFRSDPELAEAYRERQERLAQMQDIYRIRLAYAIEAARVVAQRPAAPDLHIEEDRLSIDAIRALDEAHLDRCREIHADFEHRWRPGERAAVARHRKEIARLVAGTHAIAIAGGHVAVLLNRLKLFDLASCVGDRPILAWSAGTMAIAERVVLFHDDPPDGKPIAEVLDEGLGLARGVVPLPNPRLRLSLSEPARVRLFAHRFAPAACLAMDRAAEITWDGSGWARGLRIQRLGTDGGVEELGATVSSVTPALVETEPMRKLVVDTGDGATGRLAIEALTQGTPSPAAIDALLKHHSFPLVEGPSVTFAWRGEADEVRLRHSIYGLSSAQPLNRIGRSDLWYLIVEIPPRSRVEYKLEIDRGGRRDLVLDPLNSATANDPFGVNSVVRTEGYEVPAWTHPDPEGREGSLDEITIASKHLDGARRVQLYLPARFRQTRRYPLAIVFDGSDYMRYSRMKIVLDNLIQRLEIPDLVVAFTDSPDRLREYAADEGHARFVAEELVPHLEERLPLSDKPAGRCLVGASFGAVAALSTAWRFPGLFGRLLLQSGSFAFTDIGRRNHRGPLFDPVVDFVNRFRAQPTAISDRVFVSCGVYESLIYENRSLVPLLTSTGMNVKFVESRDSHNWENWRDRLREGLSFLFPGPLLLVYD